MSKSFTYIIEQMNSYTLSLEELKLALILAHSSAFVYHPEMGKLADKLKNKTNISFKEPFHLARKNLPNISGFLGYYQDYMLIAFRGTYNLRDWKTDLQFWQKEYTYTPVERDNYVGKVHNGFNQAIDENWHELQSLIEKYSNKSRKLLLTGHSLGGALAVLTANRLINITQFQAVYTYGAPRVGDRDFENAYIPTHYRFEYGDDPAPHVPLRKLPNYEHTGEIRYLPKVLQNQQDIYILYENPSFRILPIVRSTAKFGVGVARTFQGMINVFQNKNRNKGIKSIQQGIDITSKSKIELLIKEHDIQNYINHIESYWKGKYPFDYLEEQLDKQ